MSDKRISRNDPCLCGSGKKYKKCCFDIDRGSSQTEFPIGTVALYGPDDKVTTKIAAGVIIADGAEAIIGTANQELLAKGSSLRWVQVGSAGVERYLRIPQLSSGKVLLTNGQRLASKTIGEHVMALTRALSRGLNRAVAAQNEGQWKRGEIGNSAPLTVLRGKTMLVVGLGGIGTEVARLADGAGMRVLAIRNSRRVGPQSGPLAELMHVVGDEE